MIKLYGLRMSNYYSLVKTLLIEKGLEFEEVKTMPSQKEEFLARSPMGKMPTIQVGEHYLSESLAIATYLERLQPKPALLPIDAFEAAKVIELSCHLKLNIELVARRLLPEVLFKQPVSQETRDAVRPDLEKGLKAVSRLFVGAPYTTGDTVTLADFYTFYCFDLATRLTRAIYDIELLADYPKIQQTIALLANHPSIASVETDRAT